VSPRQESSLRPIDSADLLAAVSVAAGVAQQQGALEVPPVIPRPKQLAWAVQHADSSHR